MFTVSHLLYFTFTLYHLIICLYKVVRTVRFNGHQFDPRISKKGVSQLLCNHIKLLEMLKNVVMTLENTSRNMSKCIDVIYNFVLFSWWWFCFYAIVKSYAPLVQPPFYTWRPFNTYTYKLIKIILRTWRVWSVDFRRSTVQLGRVVKWIMCFSVHHFISKTHIWQFKVAWTFSRTSVREKVYILNQNWNKIFRITRYIKWDVTRPTSIGKLFPK